MRHRPHAWYTLHFFQVDKGTKRGRSGNASSGRLAKKHSTTAAQCSAESDELEDDLDVCEEGGNKENDGVRFAVAL